MITVELLGGPADGRRWVCTDPQPPPIFMIDIRSTWKDLVCVPAEQGYIPSKVGLYERTGAPTADGVYQYAWRGIR